MAKQKTKSIISMDPADLSSLSGSDLRQAYRQVWDVARHRVSAFKSKGLTQAIPGKYKQGVPGLRDLKTESNIRQALREAAAWMRGTTSTVSGYERAEPSRLEKLRHDTGIDFQSQEEINRFDRFMKEVRERYKEMKYKPSDDAIDLFEQAQRLNINENQLLKNFDYWADHIDDLREAEPINTRADSVSPGRYRAALGLETIRSWKDR